MAGRPPKLESDRKSATFRIRLTPSEREQVNQAAANAGMDASTWARSQLLRLSEVTTETDDKAGHMP